MAAKEKPLAQRVRDVLKHAGEPLKAGEIRELLGDDEVTSVEMGAALYQLADQGAVHKEGERGAYRYHLVPGWKPARAPKVEPAAEPVDRRRPRPHLPVAETPVAPTDDTPVAADEGASVEHILERLTAAVPGASTTQDLRLHTIMLPRRTVRLLVAGLLVLGGDLTPYQDAIAEAVRESA